MDKRQMPLDVIEVEQPCSVPWEEMDGDARARFCGHCGKYVHNLSAMPRDKAERLVCESAGNLCVRFARDRNGVVVTLDYDRSAGRRRGWRFWAGMGTGGGLLAALFNAMLFGRGGPPFGTPIAQGGIMCLPTTLPTTAPTTLPATGTGPATRPAMTDGPDPAADAPSPQDDTSEVR